MCVAAVATVDYTLHNSLAYKHNRFTVLDTILLSCLLVYDVVHSALHLTFSLTWPVPSLLSSIFLCVSHVCS